jgi:hypothetical protein
MRPIDEINIHCAATRPGWMAERTGAERVAEIRRWHVQLNGWKDIGYHFIVDRDGQVYPGRPVHRTGAFEPKVNATAIGICLLGGHGAAATDAFEQHYTAEQGAALRALIDRLRAEHPGITKVTGHNQYAAKACPGFNVGRWLAGKAPARAFTETGTAVGAGSATVAAAGLGGVEVLRIVTETRAAVQQAADTPPADPVRWVLLAVVLAGAAYALWRRWQDYQAGRK